MADRIYLIVDEEAEGRCYLVRAGNAATAVRHVTRARFTASVAGQQALVDLTAKGVKVETAGAG